VCLKLNAKRYIARDPRDDGSWQLHGNSGFLRDVRPAKRAPFERRFGTPPGQRAQVDFADRTVEFTPSRQHAMHTPARQWRRLVSRARSGCSLWFLAIHAGSGDGLCRARILNRRRPRAAWISGTCWDHWRSCGPGTVDGARPERPRRVPSGPARPRHQRRSRAQPRGRAPDVDQQCPSPPGAPGQWIIHRVRRTTEDDVRNLLRGAPFLPEAPTGLNTRHDTPPSRIPSPVSHVALSAPPTRSNLPVD